MLVLLTDNSCGDIDPMVGFGNEAHEVRVRVFVRLVSVGLQP
jgi:hypothetical protein